MKHKPEGDIIEDLWEETFYDIKRPFMILKEYRIMEESKMKQCEWKDVNTSVQCTETFEPNKRGRARKYCDTHSIATQIKKAKEQKANQPIV